MSPAPEPFELNWLCFFLVLIALPIIGLIGSLCGYPSSMPVHASVALGVIGVALLAGKPGSFAFGDILLSKLSTAFFIVLCDVSLLIVALQRHQLPNASFVLTKAASLIVTIGLGLHLLVKAEPRYGRLHAFVAGLLAMLFGGATVHGMLILTVRYLPVVYDPVALRLEQMLHLNNVTLFTRFLFATSFGTDFLLGVYNLLFAGVLLAAISEFRHTQNPLAASSFLRFLLIGLIGYPLYYVMPAVAPQPFYDNLFPDHLPVIPLIAAHAVALPFTTQPFDPRNTIPSLHATWAITAFLALRHSPFWHRLLGLAFVLAILIVTLGLGQHYTIDWLVAFPLVLLVRGLCAISLGIQSEPRRLSVITGCLLISLWAITIRGAPGTLVHPPLIWALAIASCLVPLWLGRRLAYAEDHTFAVLGGAQTSPSEPDWADGIGSGHNVSAASIDQH
ncbi:MAG: phosphatase PAP2 family protein [Acidocella sp.]|nr:phosphatase PAP2 family protein [Acidocella sp.]